MGLFSGFTWDRTHLGVYEAVHLLAHGSVQKAGYYPQFLKTPAMEHRRPESWEMEDGQPLEGDAYWAAYNDYHGIETGLRDGAVIMMQAIASKEVTAYGVLADAAPAIHTPLDQNIGLGGFLNWNDTITASDGNVYATQVRFLEDEVQTLRKARWHNLSKAQRRGSPAELVSAFLSVFADDPECKLNQDKLRRQVKDAFPKAANAALDRARLAALDQMPSAVREAYTKGGRRPKANRPT